MNINQAIKILERHHKAAVCQLHKEIGDATQLGFEALTRERECRENAPKEEWLLLPSETKD